MKNFSQLWKFVKDSLLEKPHQTMKKFFVLPRRLISKTTRLKSSSFSFLFYETMCFVQSLPSLNPIYEQSKIMWRNNKENSKCSEIFATGKLFLNLCLLHLQGHSYFSTRSTWKEHPKRSFRFIPIWTTKNSTCVRSSAGFFQWENFSGGDEKREKIFPREKISEREF